VTKRRLIENLDGGWATMHLRVLSWIAAKKRKAEI
jgi:hypothetical protein